MNLKYWQNWILRADAKSCRLQTTPPPQVATAQKLNRKSILKKLHRQQKTDYQSIMGKAKVIQEQKLLTHSLVQVHLRMEWTNG